MSYPGLLYPAESMLFHNWALPPNPEPRVASSTNCVHPPLFVPDELRLSKTAFISIVGLAESHVSSIVWRSCSISETNLSGIWVGLSVAVKPPSSIEMLAP